MIDRWKLARWLYDFEAEVDSHGVQIVDWESRPQRVKDAYYAIGAECIEAACSAPVDEALVEKLEALVTAMNMEIERNIMRKAISVVRQHQSTLLAELRQARERIAELEGALHVAKYCVEATGYLGSYDARVKGGGLVANTDRAISLAVNCYDQIDNALAEQKEQPND